MERIRELLDRLVSLSDSEIAELEGLILSEFEGVEQQDPTAGTVDMMTTLADALDSVRSETSRRTLEQQELSRRAKDAASRVRAEAANKPEDAEATNKPQDAESPAEDVAEPGEEPGEPARGRRGCTTTRSACGSRSSRSRSSAPRRDGRGEEEAAGERG